MPAGALRTPYRLSHFNCQTSGEPSTEFLEKSPWLGTDLRSAEGRNKGQVLECSKNLNNEVLSSPQGGGFWGPEFGNFQE